MEVGKRIRYFREKSSMSQNMLADKAGLSQSHLRRVELGESRITVDHLEMVCDALGITLKDFFDFGSQNQDFSSAISNLTSKQRQLLLEFLKSL